MTLEASMIIALWEDWQRLVTEGKLNPGRFNQDFFDRYKDILKTDKPEQAPYTLMFQAFVGGIDVMMQAQEEGDTE